MFEQQEHTLLSFLTNSMVRKKTVCCGASALEVSLAILLVTVTGVCVTLIALMVTRKTHTGNKRHTLRTESQMPAERKSKRSL